MTLTGRHVTVSLPTDSWSDRKTERTERLLVKTANICGHVGLLVGLHGGLEACALRGRRCELGEILRVFEAPDAERSWAGFSRYCLEVRRGCAKKNDSMLAWPRCKLPGFPALGELGTRMTWFGAVAEHGSG